MRWGLMRCWEKWEGESVSEDLLSVWERIHLAEGRHGGFRLYGFSLPHCCQTGSPERLSAQLRNGYKLPHESTPPPHPQALSWSYSLEGFHAQRPSSDRYRCEENILPSTLGDAFSQLFVGPASVLLCLCQMWLPHEFLFRGPNWRKSKYVRWLEPSFCSHAAWV